jgi:hypothetical protein
MKRFFYISVLAVFSLAVIGCTTTRAVKGQPTPQGQAVIVNGDRISYFDKKPSSFDPMDNGLLVIPAGEHTLRVSYNSSYTLDVKSNTVGSTTYTTTTYISYSINFSCAFDFEAGKKYRIKIPAVRYDSRTGSLYMDDPKVKTTVDRSAKKVNFVSTSLEIAEDKGGGVFAGKTFISPEFGMAFDIGYMYNNKLAVRGGIQLGASIISGPFDIKIIGEAKIGPGIAPDFIFAEVEDMFDFPYSVGGVFEMYFPGKFCLAPGGGFMGSLFKTLGSLDHGDSEFGFIPYVELGLLNYDTAFLGTGTGDLYFQYYFDNSREWYSNIGVGLKGSF